MPVLPLFEEAAGAARGIEDARPADGGGGLVALLAPVSPISHKYIGHNYIGHNYVGVADQRDGGAGRRAAAMPRQQRRVLAGALPSNLPSNLPSKLRSNL